RSSERSRQTRNNERGLQFEFQYVARDRGWCLMEFINDIMNYGFLQKALITSVVVGIICGIIGSFIILRGLALMGDAISHAVLPGVAISYMLGINFSDMFALGIILITAAQSATDLTQILFGNVLSVRDSDMWMTIVVGIIVILAVVIFYKELLVSSFDETMAQAYGLKTRLIHY